MLGAPFDSFLSIEERHGVAESDPGQLRVRMRHNDHGSVRIGDKTEGRVFHFKIVARPRVDQTPLATSHATQPGDSMRLARFLCLGSTLVLLSAHTTWAQGGAQRQQPQPITSEVKDAGTYHVATGTWTRNADLVAMTGPSQLYDNTCTVGLFNGLGFGVSSIDSGRIPSSDDGGLADCYEVNCFQIGYCTYEPLVTSISIAFFDCYAACDDLAAAPVAAVLALLNVPGGGFSREQGCWLVTFDMTNTTLTFNIGGNSDGIFENTPSTDHFGWAWEQIIPQTGSPAGPLIAGDPLGQFNMSCGAVDPAGQGGGVWSGFNSAGQGAGTDHPGWGFAPGPGTGIGTELDQYALDSPSGCFWFGGYGASLNPLASFYLKLWGNAGLGCGSMCGDPPGMSTSYCFGDTGNCPGGAVGNAGAGCPHGAGPNGAGGARLTPIGNASFSNDTFGFALNSGPTSLGILIQGPAAVGFPNGNANVPDSAGLFCVAPQQRGGIVFTPNDSLNAGDSDANLGITTFQGLPFGATAQPAGSITYNQFWFRDTGNPNANAGPGAEFNFSNAVFTNWVP